MKATFVPHGFYINFLGGYLASGFRSSNGEFILMWFAPGNFKYHVA